jgi:Alpha-(1,3)-fucosyltransferase FucT N-terminal domain/Glycosyltransferase family 10 (fucosyltransferase) C-term
MHPCAKLLHLDNLTMKTIRISLVGAPHDYQQGLLPVIVSSLGYQIKWVKPALSDLLIRGAFFRQDKKRYRWLPRSVRPFVSNLGLAVKSSFNPRANAPLTLFHTAENIRHDAMEADYFISFDLSVNSSRHLRFPYWMEMLDWSHEGIVGNQNPRFGQLLSISRMMQPLGNDFLKRSRRVAIFSSHLREPRTTLVRAVERIIPLEGFGPYFDKSILHHQQSGFNKVDVLQNFAFNLCPENGLYPGYYTEKIPEAFAAGCLPLTWADINVCVDFNPEAFINLGPMSWQDFEPLKEIINSPSRLEAFTEQPLLLKEPSIEPLKDFLREIVVQAVS